MIALITETVVVHVDDEAEAEALAEKMRDGIAMATDLQTSLLQHDHPDEDIARLVAEKIAVIGPTVQIIPEALTP